MKTLKLIVLYLLFFAAIALVGIWIWPTNDVVGPDPPDSTLH